jgi:hypothetical protein
MRVVARNWQGWSRGKLAFVAPCSCRGLWARSGWSALSRSLFDARSGRPHALGAGLLLVAVMALLSLPSGLIAGWRAGASAAKRRSSLLDPFE